jgi:hypothetical protein
MDKEPIPTLRDQITGRSVLIGEKEHLVWAIVVDLPVNDIIRRSLKEEVELILPSNIHTISCYHFAPQENLPESKRNIKIGKPVAPQDTAVSHLVNQISNYSNENVKYIVDKLQLVNLFKEMKIGPANRRIFNSILSGGNGNSIAIVIGHGNFKPWLVGEDSIDQPCDEKGLPLQQRGNFIPVQDVVDYLNNNLDHEAVLLHVCNPLRQEIKTSRIPTFFVKGKVGHSTLQTLTSTSHVTLAST